MDKDKVSTAEFDADQGYPWDDVMDVADQLFEELRKKGFSCQDMAHIGLRLMHLGNFAWILEGTKYVEEKRAQHGKEKDRD